MPTTGRGDQAGRDNRVGMNALTSYAEQVAANMLNRYGLAVIWELHLSAAKAYREGNGLAALSILDIADAAERIWLRRSMDNRTGSSQRRGVSRP
jgi:hypothetical protein